MGELDVLLRRKELAEQVYIDTLTTASFISDKDKDTAYNELVKAQKAVDDYVVLGLLILQLSIQTFSRSKDNNGRQGQN